MPDFSNKLIGPFSWSAHFLFSRSNYQALILSHFYVISQGP